MLEPGERLRDLRNQLKFTLRDVEEASQRLVARSGNNRFWVPESALSLIENRGLIPSIHRLYTLAAVYRRSVLELMEWYGIQSGFEELAPPPTTQLSHESAAQSFEVPTRLDPLFDSKKTNYIRRMIQEWGPLPSSWARELSQRGYTYGYIGTEDYTMYPLIMPGSFVQIDQNVEKIESGPWKSDWERPIYFLETRDGYLCGWCTLINGRELQFQPHSLSGMPARNFRLATDVDLVGQVVGVATRLRSATSDVAPEPAEIPAHT